MYLTKTRKKGTWNLRVAKTRCTIVSYYSFFNHCDKNYGGNNLGKNELFGFMALEDWFMVCWSHCFGCGVMTETSDR